MRETSAQLFADAFAARRHIERIKNIDTVEREAIYDALGMGIPAIRSSLCVGARIEGELIFFVDGSRVGKIGNTWAVVDMPGASS